MAFSERPRNHVNRSSDGTGALGSEAAPTGSATYPSTFWLAYMVRRAHLFIGQLLVVLLLAGIFSDGAAAGEVKECSEAERLTNQVLAKQLELLRLGIEIKKHAESKKLWRERRFSFYALANSSLTSIGAFMAGAGRLHYASTPKKAPNSLFENATILRVIANSVSVGGVLIELSKDTVDGIRERRNKSDLRSIVKRAEVLNVEIAELYPQRSAAVGKVTDDSVRKLYQAEEVVLNDVHEAVLDEFGALYAEAKGKKARRVTQLVLTGTSNLVSGAGSLYSGVIVPHRFKSDPIKRAQYGGVGGITDIATGSTNVATPLLATSADIWRRGDTQAVLFKQIGAGDVEDLQTIRRHEEQVKACLTLNGSAPVGFEERRKAIATVIEIFEKHKQLNESERKHAVQKLVLSVVDSGVDSSGSFSKIVNGVGTTVGAYRYTRDSSKRFLVTGRAGITYGIGNAIGVEEVIRDGVRRELKHHSQEKRHALLSQLLDDELTAIKDAQSSLNRVK